MDTITFRALIESDSKAMYDIASKVNVHQLDFVESGRGFLVHSLDDKSYAELIGHQLQTLGVFADGQLVGYLVGNYVCGDQTDNGLQPNGYFDQVGQAICDVSKTLGDKMVLYLDQIAIHPDYQGRGLGKRLFFSYVEMYSGPFYALILEKPLRHPRIEFWCSIGFSRVAGVCETLREKFEPGLPPLSDSELCWGIYRLIHRS